MSLLVQSPSETQPVFWGCSPAACIPPRGFRPAGDVLRAWPVASGPFSGASLRGRSAAQKAGIRYERKVLRELQHHFGGESRSAFHSSPWLRFEGDGGNVRYCQPDGLLLREEGAIIFEVKYSFTSDAYYQLRQLYAPVVRRAYLPKKVSLVLICRNFDVSRPFPEKPFLMKSHLEIDGYDREEIGVAPWTL